MIVLLSIGEALIVELLLKAPGIEAELKPRPKYEAPNYRPAGKLEGKVALVTGGDSGIGRAVAIAADTAQASGLQDAQ